MLTGSLPELGDPEQPHSAVRQKVPPSAAQVLRLALFAAVATFILRDALPHLSTHFLGKAVTDAWGTQWHYTNTYSVLQGNQAASHSDLFFFPVGQALYETTGNNILDAVAATPFRLLFGPVLGFNLFVLAAWFWSTWLFYRLVHDFVEDHITSTLATSLFMVEGISLFELQEGRPTQAILGLLIIAIHCGWRIGIRTRWRDAVVGGVALALVGYQYWFFALFCAVALSGLGLVRVTKPPSGAGSRRSVMARFGLMALLSLLLAAPGAGPMLHKSAVQPDSIPGLLDTDALRNGRVVLKASASSATLYQWTPFPPSASLVYDPLTNQKDHSVDPDLTEQHLENKFIRSTKCLLFPGLGLLLLLMVLSHQMLLWNFKLIMF